MTVLECRQAARQDYQLAIVRDLEGIEGIRPIWTKMQLGERFATPHADIERYIASVRANDNEARPFVILAKQGDIPTAMTIGRIEMRPLRIRVGYKALLSAKMKCLTVVYGGIIGKPSDDCCKVMIGELVDAIRRREADVILLNHLRTDSPMYRVCKADSGLRAANHSTLEELHWRTELPDSVEMFYSRIPNSRKQRWKRNVRQLEKLSSSEVRVVCYRQLSDVDRVIKAACRIEDSTYKKSLAAAFTDSALNRALLEQAARDGWLNAYFLYVGDEPCAFQLDTRYRGTQFTEYGSFDPKWSRGSPGIVLLTKVLEQLCEEPDVSAADYGFGHAPYKEKFGTDSWPEESIYIYAPRFRPMLVRMAMSAAQALSVPLARATARLSLDSWVKRNWRRMLRNRRN